jgi:hypothetical protein
LIIDAKSSIPYSPWFVTLLELTQALSRAEFCRMPGDGRYFVDDVAATCSGVIAEGRREITWVTGMAG